MKDESYISIGQALGEVDTVNVGGGRVRVQINADEPLRFERRAGYSNGNVITVNLRYEELHRYCYTCKKISHEEGTCPDLTPEQREINRVKRLEEKDKEEQAAKEAFSFPVRGNSYTSFTQAPHLGRPSENRHGDPYRGQGQRIPPKEKSPDRKIGYGDLRRTIVDKREHSGRTLWNRLEGKYEDRYEKRYDGGYPRTLGEVSPISEESIRISTKKIC